MKQANNSQKQKRSKMPFIIVSIIIAIIILLFSFKTCSTPTYTITFKNYDDSVIEVIKVKEGELPQIDRIPTRDSDGIFEYIFDSWGNIVNAEKDTTYKAKFTSILIEKDNDDIQQEEIVDDKDDVTSDLEGKYFYINFLDDNGTVIESSTFKYGSIPYCTKDIPNKTIDGYLYTFAGWNKTLSRVTGNTTYKATYNKTYVGGGGGGSHGPSVTKYTVSFVLESGQGTAPSNQQVPSGSKATQPSINCGGYIIEHWYEDNAYTTEWDFSTGTITEAKTLYGKWENKYAVTLDYQGKATNTFFAVESGSTVPTLQNPTVSGYEFIEWQSYITDGHGQQVLSTFDPGTTITGPLTLYAKWGVKFIFNTEPYGQAYIPPSITIPIGNTLLSTATGTVSPQSEYEGKYMWSGAWYKNSSKTTLYDMDQQVNGPGPITLYSGWNIVVKLKKVHGGEIETFSVPPGSKFTKPDDPVDVFDDGEDYIFKGWYTDENTFLNEFNFNTNITAPLTLYSKWAQLFTVTFNSTDLSESIDPIVVETGSKISMPETTIPSGYVFKGWFKDTLLQNQWDFNTDTVTADTTLYPRVDVSVLFDKHGHGGSGVINPVSVRPGEKITAPSPDPSETGYTFGGWYKDDTYASSWNFATDTVDAPTTLHAKWTVTLNYHYQGKGSDTTASVVVDKTLTKPADPTYTGYLFKGWYTDEACTETNKWDFDNDVVTEATDLYAKWVKIPSKYDAITLEGKNYRILKDNGDNQFLVLALFDSDNKVNYETDWESDDHYVIFSGAQGGIKYEGSELDTFLNTTWYDDLSDEMQAAIQSTDIEQNIYHAYSGSPSNDNYVIKGKQKSSGSAYYITGGFNPVTIENRKVYALDVSDIINYLGKDNFTQKNIQTMYNTTAGNHYLWLRSASIYGRNNSCYVDTGNGGIWNVYGVNGDGYANPAFVIDLDLIDYSLTAVDKFNVTVESNDSDYGTVNTEGGTYPNGFELRIEAKEKPGYMFVSWDDGNTNKSRFVTVSENKTYTAQFEEKIPTKGDIVTLGGKKYRVLDYNSTTGHAKLLSLYDLKIDQKYYEGDVTTTTIGDYTVAKYDGSNLDTYLNTTWYSSLNSVIQNAIIDDTSLKQNMYSVSLDDSGDYISTIITDEGSPSWSTPYQKYLYSNSVQGATITSKKVYAPDFSDIISYLGTNNLTINNITKMFHDTDGSNNTVWLRSGMFDISDPTNEYAKESACTTDPFASYGDGVTVAHAVHAMFTINLKATGITYDLTKVPKYTVTVSADDETHGSVEGGGIFNEYTEVTVTATPNEGYAFVNWNGDEYNTSNPNTIYLYEDTNLVANFVKMPSKGDVIQLNDGKNYRVLKADGSKVTVVGQYRLDQKAYATSPGTTTFGGDTGINYDGSTLHSYLQNWAYNVLWNDETTSPMSGGMDYVTIMQGLYSYNEGSPADDNFAVRGMKTNGDYYYLTGGATSDGSPAYSYAYPLDISHFASYLGEDNLTKKNINNMLFGSDDSTASLWLTSADGNSSSKALYYDASNGVISSDVASAIHDVYPAFIIDLTYSGVEYDIVSEASKYTITATSDDDDMGTVRMTGGPKFIDGTEVLLTAKPESGYKFVKWQIDGTDDVSDDKNNATRYITISDNETYTAVFEEDASVNKGDIIKIDNKRYRVLKIDDDKAFVTALYTIDQSDIASRKFGEGSSNVYKDSYLDTNITNWYESLDNGDPLKVGIIPTTNLVQNEFNEDLTEKTTVEELGSRNVFALDVQDLIDYFGNTDNLKITNNINAVFELNISSDSFWLRSSRSNSANWSWFISGFEGKLDGNSVDIDFGVCPAFTIDLSKIDFGVDDTVDKYTISVATSDADKGSASGGGTCNKGTTTTINAIPEDGYRFVKWNDESTLNPRTIVATEDITYTASFEEIIYPAQGDVIRLGNFSGNRYRVLKINDKKALVIGLFNAADSQKYWTTPQTVDFVTGPPPETGVKYEGSDLDIYLNTTWYNQQSDTLKGAIVPETTLYQRIYQHNTDYPIENYITKGIDDTSNPYFISNNITTPVSISGERNVFALEVQDIADYFNGDDVNPDKIKAVFDITEGSFWLRSAVNADSNRTWIINGSSGCYDRKDCNFDGPIAARPAFYVDLSKIYFVVDDTVAGFQVIVNTGDETQGTVTGGGNYNKGAAVTISATPKPGFKFVKWSDENTSNPRTVIITDNLTLEAVFEPETP